MDTTFQQEELRNTEILDAAISELCPTAKIRNIGAGLMVIHANGSVSNVFPITNTLCDFSSDTCEDDEIERAGLDWNTTLRLVKAIDNLSPIATAEQSNTAGVSPVANVPYSGSYQPAGSWWKKGNHVPDGHPSASLNQIAEATALAEKLLEAKHSSSPDDDAPAEDDEIGYHQAMRELAEASGKASDILRNKDLLNLDGLGVESSPADDDVTLDEFLASMTPTPSHLEGRRSHNGHPVSLNEARDISKPYSATLGNMVLVDLGFPHGPTLVDKALMPKRKFLSNAPASEGGVCWVEGIENVCYKRPKFMGRG